MSYQLTDLLQDAYADLGALRNSVATGGSATTILDSVKDGEGKDNDWQNGAAFVVSTTDSSAPMGEFAKITSSSSSTWTLTLGSSLSAAVGSGDRYGYTTPEFPLDVMIERVNDALRDLGDIALVDESLTSASDTTEYAVPVALKRMPPVRVQYQGRTNNANDDSYIDIRDWDYVPAAGGSTATIVVPQLPLSRTIRLWYVDQHPRVEDYNDVINETIHPRLATAAVVEKALQWVNRRNRGGDRFLLQTWNDAKVELQNAKQEFPIWRPSKKEPMVMPWGVRGYDKNNLETPST